MIKQGIGPDKVPLYLVDGNLSNTLYKDLPKGSMEGTQGTLPGAEASAEFQKPAEGDQPRPRGLLLRT